MFILTPPDLKKLAEPFPEDMIEWRIQSCGIKGGKAWAMCLAYIQSRAIMDRLDAVCGPEGWKVEYTILPDGVIATLSIKCGSEWVSKQDGAEQTDIESFKGGLSSALKRAGSVWGIGRYLYDLEAGFAQTSEGNAPGMRFAKTKDNQVFYWAPPKLPAWALPKKEAPIEAQSNKALPVKRIDQAQAVPTVEAPPSPPASVSPQKEATRTLSERQVEVQTTLKARTSAWTQAEAAAYMKERFNLERVDDLSEDAYGKLLFVLREQTAQSASAVLRATSAVAKRAEPEEDVP